MNLHRTAELIKKHEGLVLFPYLCTSKKITIGYGRNLQDGGITPQEAELLLNNDLKNTVNEIVSEFTWFEGLNDDRQSVVINMVFNLGMPRFKGFKKLIEALEERDFDTAYEEMLNSKWAAQVGDRAIELADAMQHGTF